MDTATESSPHPTTSATEDYWQRVQSLRTELAALRVGPARSARRGRGGGPSGSPHR